MSPYRQPGEPGRENPRRVAIFQARRVRDALVKAPHYLDVLIPLLWDEAHRREPLVVHPIGALIRSPQEIIDALTACIDVLEAETPEEPF